MPLVVLMDRAHHAGMPLFEGLRHGKRTVGRTVVDDQHFDVIVAFRGDQRLDAPSQIRFHVVRGHHEGERLLLLHILPWVKPKASVTVADRPIAA